MPSLTLRSSGTEVEDQSALLQSLLGDNPKLADVNVGEQLWWQRPGESAQSQLLGYVLRDRDWVQTRRWFVVPGLDQRLPIPKAYAEAVPHATDD